MRVVAPTLALLLIAGCNRDPGKGDGDATIPTDPGPPHDIGSWLSMKAMPDGTIGIAYYDRTMGGLGFAIGTISGGGITWAHEEVDSFPDENGLNPGDAGRYASLAVAADGTAWVAYQDISNGNLKYAKRDPSTGAWTTGLADVGGGGRPDSGYWASIALAPGDAPVLTHYDKAEQNLRIVRWTGSAFTASVVAEGEDYVPADTAQETVEGNLGEYAKIAISADGTEYIAFYDRAWGALKLATGSRGTFSVETVDDTADVGQWPDILVDGVNVKIAYHDVTNQDLKYAMGSPGRWAIQTLDAGDYRGADSALYVDGDTVGAFYFDGVNNDVIRGSTSGTSWSSGKAGGDGLALGYHNETVSVGGARYVASYDYTNRTIWFAAAG